jgi:hypothetical protein
MQVSSCDTDGARLALRHDVVEHSHRLLERRVEIRPMHQINVDMIGVEIAQTLFQRRHDPRATAVSAIGRVRIADADLGHEADIAPPRAQSERQRPFGNPHAIRFSGIEAIDPGVERPMHRLLELGRVDRTVGSADLPAAKAYGGNLRAGSAELPVLHGASSCPCHGRGSVFLLGPDATYERSRLHSAARQEAS